MKKEEIREYLLSRDLKAMDLVRMSFGLIGLNQASGWIRKLKRGDELSNPVLVMIVSICELKDIEERDKVVPDRRVVAKWVDTSDAVGRSSVSDESRLDRIEQALKERGLL